MTLSRDIIQMIGGFFSSRSAMKDSDNDENADRASYKK